MTDIDHSSRAHSRCSPSGSSQWMTCTASIGFVESLIAAGKIKANTTSEAAEEGTGAHELLEKCRNTGKPPEAFRGKTFNGFIADTEMIDAVDNALTYLHLIEAECLEPECHSELMVPLPWIDGKGHIDEVILDRMMGVLHVFDYKHGKGVFVDVEENTQLGLYALGALAHFCLDLSSTEVILHIGQPRCLKAGHSTMRSWEASPAWLASLIFDSAEAYNRIDDGKGVFNPGDKQCYWCDARNHCEARAKFMFEEAGADFDEFIDTGEVTLPCKDVLEPDMLAKIMNVAPQLQSFLKGVVERSNEILLNGGTIPGFKLVVGQSTRKWKDEKRLITALKKYKLKPMDYMSEPKILGLGAIEKLVPKEERKDFMDKHTVKPEGKPTMVPETDPRPPVSGAADDFEDLLD